MYQREDMSECKECGLGYEPNFLQTDCDQCSGGQYKDSTMVKCKPCPPGQYSQNGAGMCSKCPTNSVVNDDQTACVSCSGINPNWSNILTETQFPIPPGTEVSVFCRPGHTLSGDTAVTCLQDTEFHFTTPPLCTFDTCSSLPKIPNLQTEAHFPISHGDVLKVFCEDGYDLRGDELITCSKDTDFIFFTQPTCKQKVCESLPPDIENLKTETVFPVSHGTVVTVGCKGSMELRGDSVITCDDGTAFIFVEKPKCNNPDTCTELPPDLHVWTDHAFPVKKNTEVHVNCKTGYTHKSGYLVLTCLQDAVFTAPHLPLCQIDTCSSLPTPLYSMRTKQDFPVNYGEVVRLYCIPGYEMEGDNSITCKQGETFFNMDSPSCILDTCTGLPAVADIQTTAQFPVVVGTEVEITCPPGHVMSGSTVITCIRNLDYHIKKIPTCTIDVCKGPLLENHIKMTASYPMVYGSKVTVECQEGYNLQGSSVITCEKGIIYSYTWRPRCVSSEL
ncbi:hypothetical protein ACHWQZ_G006558 [Mnemiopsis leidyi]